MTFLEFLRKHLIIAIIAIAGILLGLVLMDYGDSGSTFSRDYLVEINGTRYKQNDVAQLAMDTERHLSRLSGLSGIDERKKEIFQDCDFNNNGKIDGAEETVVFENLYLKELAAHPFFKLQKAFNLWKQIGPFQTENTRELNLATARYIVREEAKQKGFTASDEQITAYIKNMMAFRNEAGEFSMERYKDYVGTTANGETNASNERNFREMVSDLMAWDAICTYYTAGLSVDEKAEREIEDFANQTIDGWIASYNISNAPEAAEPQEEEIQSYHANNRNKYLTGELRTYSLIKIDAKEGMNAENFADYVAELQEALVKAPAATPNSVIREAIRTSESGLPRDLKYNVSEPATCDSSNISDALKIMVKDNNADIELSSAVFNTALKASGAARYSSYYMAPDGKAAYIVRIENIQAATPLEYAQAREAALADLKAVNKANLFSKTVDELYNQIAADLADGKDMQTAFNAAKERCEHLQIEEVKQMHINTLALMNMGDLPTSREEISDRYDSILSALRSTPNRALAPLNKATTSATIIGINDHKAAAMTNNKSSVQQFNADLHMQIMQGWLSAAYERYETKLPSKD